MKHSLIVLVIMLGTVNGLNAQKFYTKTGVTHFKGSVDTFEPVEAENKSTTAIFNLENGQVAAVIFIKSFHFKVALMEEHFNENYMDSDEFPKAKFQGQILYWDINSLTGSNQKFIVEGTLSIHGQSKAIKTSLQVRKKGDIIFTTGEFKVSPSDFNIEIPSIVRSKIAQEITISFDYQLQAKP